MLMSGKGYSKDLKDYNEFPVLISEFKRFFWGHLVKIKLKTCLTQDPF